MSEERGCCAISALRSAFILLAFMLFGCSWMVTTDRSTRWPDNLGFCTLVMCGFNCWSTEIYNNENDYYCCYITVIITVVCNYKVYPQNSCSVEDDQRGVSLCLNIGLKAEETLYNPRGLLHALEQPFWKSRPLNSAA